MVENRPGFHFNAVLTPALPRRTRGRLKAGGLHKPLESMLRDDHPGGLSAMTISKLCGELKIMESQKTKDDILF